MNNSKTDKEKIWKNTPCRPDFNGECLLDFQHDLPMLDQSFFVADEVSLQLQLSALTGSLLRSCHAEKRPPELLSKSGVGNREREISGP